MSTGTGVINWFRARSWGDILLGAFLGFLISGFFYWLSLSRPNVVLWQDPVASQILDINQTGTRLIKVVNIDGSEIKKDLYTLRAIFWNKGPGGLRHENIIEQPRISLVGTNVEILQLAVEKVSRTNINLVAKRVGNDIEIDFKALEPDDGVLLQITYAGDTHAVLEVRGAFDNQKKIRRAVRQTIFEENPPLRWSIYGMVVMQIFLTPTMLRPWHRNRLWSREGFFAVLLNTAVVLLLMGGHLLPTELLPNMESWVVPQR